MRHLRNLTGTQAGVSGFVLWCAFVIPTTLFADEFSSPKRSLLSSFSEVETQLPRGTQVLADAASIELFLWNLEGKPPDWSAVYGSGHRDHGLDERLFQFNRKRDAKRKENDALHSRIAFVWDGELSAYDPEAGGFRVALGPRLTHTTWGVVRFKYDDLPGNLIAVPSPSQRRGLVESMVGDQSREIEVVMFGTLIPEESIVYGFSHDQEGVGLIMPVVHIEGIFYLKDSTPSRRSQGISLR